MPKAKTTKVWMQKVRVHLSGVPFDMMRYDHCFPSTEEDSRKLWRISHHDDKENADREVTFLRVSLNGEGPNVGRWASFNCRVVGWESV